MMRFLSKLFAKESTNPQRQTARPAPRRSLRLEGLERRELMAADFQLASQLVINQPLQLATMPVQTAPAPSAVSVSLENHDLVIRGTDGPDDVMVSYAGGKFIVTVTTLVNGRASTSTSSWRLTGGDVFFYGNAGNDTFQTSFTTGAYLRVTADGGDGRDQLTGSWGVDNLWGGNGDDTLNGHANDDLLDGGFGYDQILGSDGNDTIRAGLDYAPNYVDGGYGNDTIIGGYGIDELFGGAGDDVIDGNLGQDYLFGNDGNDILRAGTDYDYNYLDGGHGNDRLYGSNGGDMLLGRAGDDYLMGQGGNDHLNGGPGRDHCYGQDGDDFIDGGGDDNLADILYGGEGRDTFNYEYDFDGDPPAWAFWVSEYDPPQSYTYEVMDYEPGIDDPDRHYGP